MNRNKRTCRICGRKLCKLNPGNTCFHHDFPKDFDPPGQLIREQTCFSGGPTGNNAAYTQALENGGYAYE